MWRKGTLPVSSLPLLETILANRVIWMVLSVKAFACKTNPGNQNIQVQKRNKVIP